MKVNLLFSALCFLNAVSVSAQPMLTAATNMPTIGLRSQVYNSNQFAAGAGGANQTWDFSTATYGGSLFGSYQPCTVGNGCSNFAGATMAYSYGGTFMYYGVSANTITVQGFFSGGPNNYYTNSEDYLRFPFTYGNSFVDSFAGNYLGMGGTWYRKGVDTVTADGWGTLKTPGTTFPNTLRIKTVSTYTDSGIIMGLPDRITYKSYTYNWYDVAHKDFLYTTANIVVTPKSGGPQTVSYARYTDRQTLGILPTVSAGLHCQIVQNPARGRVQVAINLDAAARVALSLTDITGRVVGSLPAVDLAAGEGKLSMPVAGLPGGIYNVRVVTGDAVAAMKVVIE